MPVQTLNKDDQYVLNHCTKYLARDTAEPRHNFGQYSPDDVRARLCEPWRFPVIDSYSDGTHFEQGYAFNEVTFVHARPGPSSPQRVSVVGTFASLYDPIPLRPVSDTGYYTVTLVVPKGEVHIYKFIVDGQLLLDPIN